eukprot:gene5007-3602_t
MTTNPDIEADVPSEVIEFLQNLNRAVENHNTTALHELYESQFDMLTKNFYVPAPGQSRPWPSLRLKVVSDPLRHKHAELLYSFLYYKHLFTDKGVKLQDAKLSWGTFTEIFSSLPNFTTEIPSWMMWDMFDEFVFQMTVVYQKRFSGRTEWSVIEVFKLLDTVIAASGVEGKLEKAETAEELVKPGSAKSLSGYFAIITKAKVNVLLGDYYAALSDLKPLDIFNNGRGVLQKVSPAHISLLYHVGFSYLMLNRYEDASNSFRRCLSVKSSGRKFSERVQLDAAYMFVCARVLGGMPISNVTSFLDSRKASTFEDDKESLRSGDEERFREVFDRCSPKFLTVPPLSTSARGSEGKELQARMFRRAVQQQQEIIKLRGYFGVYQNAKMDLLKTLLETDDGYAPLFALKMRSRQLVHDGESADLLSGTFKVSAQFDCIVEDGNVEVVPYTSFDSVETKFVNKIKYLTKDYRVQQQRKEQNDQRPFKNTNTRNEKGGRTFDNHRKPNHRPNFRIPAGDSLLNRNSNMNQTKRTTTRHLQIAGVCEMSQSLDDGRCCRGVMPTHGLRSPLASPLSYRCSKGKQKHFVEFCGEFGYSAMFSDDDEFPPIPMAPYPDVVVRSSGAVTERLRQLEDDVALLKRAVQLQRSGESSPRSSQPRVADKCPDASVAAVSPAAPSQSNTTAAADIYSVSFPDGHPAPSREEVYAEVELRRLVPHLSPGFHCTYQDCVLITAAIRNGGCTTSRGRAGKEDLSLQDRLTMADAEKKQLESRLSRQGAECEMLKARLAEQREKFEAAKKDAKLSTTHVVLKRDEMRRQLLLEETRSEKLRVQNRKLEMELEQLRQRLRGNLS